jgi:hypothetical protein
MLPNIKDNNHKLDDIFVNLHWLDRDHSLELWSYFQYFRIEGPIVQVGHCALEEGCYACVTSFNVPIMTCVICEWPCYADQSDEKTNRVFSGVLVQHLTYLWPKD